MRLWRCRPLMTILLHKILHNLLLTCSCGKFTKIMTLLLTSVCGGADNVGDNVGDIAGMGADLFGSFAESTCAALVISSVSTLGTEHVYVAMSYPLLISAVGILVCLVTTLIATDLKPARGINEIESTLKLQLVISTLLATPVSNFCHDPISALDCDVSWCAWQSCWSPPT